MAETRHQLGQCRSGFRGVDLRDMAEVVKADPVRRRWSHGDQPYAAGGAYLNRMTDHCKGCPYSPSTRVGPKACLFTAGYWAFLDHNADALRHNHRLAQPYAGLARLADREQLLAEQSPRGDGPP